MFIISMRLHLQWTPWKTKKKKIIKRAYRYRATFAAPLQDYNWKENPTGRKNHSERLSNPNIDSQKLEFDRQIQNQSRVFSPQILVRLIPTVGLAILEKGEWLIFTFINLLLIAGKLLSGTSPNRSRNRKDGIAASFLTKTEDID